MCIHKRLLSIFYFFLNQPPSTGDKIFFLRQKKKVILGFVLFTLSTSVVPVHLQALELPKNLDYQDRKELIKVLGFASSTKTLDQPFSIGGYDGFEVSYSEEFLNSEKISYMGDKSVAPKDVSLKKISIGKGIYNNIDFFVNIAPFTLGENISSYGFLIKWAAWNSKYYPINFSLLLHGNSANFANGFSNENLGLEGEVGIMVNDFSIYAGGGRISAEARFMGGSGTNSIVSSSDPAINNETQILKQSLDTFHSFFGTSFNFSPFYFSAQLDRYPDDPNYSLRLGYRF